MSSHARIRRRACLGFALGLAADIALPRAAHAAGIIEEIGPGGVYKTMHSFEAQEGMWPTGVMCASDGLLHGATRVGGAYDRGTLFRFDPRGHLEVLHSFSGGRDDGYAPAGPPVEGDDGALYGLTARGGAADAGVAYRLGPEGRWEVLHHFGVDRHDGIAPQDTLLLASDGQLYGTAVGGGDRNVGIAFRMGKDGSVTPLWQFGKPGEPATPTTALIEGVDGRLYGTSFSGGADTGTVFSLAKDGSDRRVVHSFGYTSERYPDAALVQATDGYLYGTNQGGGAHGFGTAYRLAPDGSGYRVLHDFAGRMDGCNANSPLLEIEPGALVGATSEEDLVLYGGTLFALTADGQLGTLHRFGRRTLRGVPDGGWRLGRLCRLPTGELVGTCLRGGAADGGTLWFARAPDGGWGSGLQT